MVPCTIGNRTNNHQAQAVTDRGQTNANSTLNAKSRARTSIEYLPHVHGEVWFCRLEAKICFCLFRSWERWISPSCDTDHRPHHHLIICGSFLIHLVQHLSRLSIEIALLHLLLCLEGTPTPERNLETIFFSCQNHVDLQCEVFVLLIGSTGVVGRMPGICCTELYQTRGSRISPSK